MEGDITPEDRLIDNAERMYRVRQGRENINSEAWEAEMDLLADLIAKVYAKFIEKGFKEDFAYNLTLFFAETQITPGDGTAISFSDDDDEDM